MASDGGWYVEERKITREDWEQFEQRYLEELGFESEPRQLFWTDTQLCEELPAFRGETSNWAQLMPADSALRLETADRPYDEFKEIVKETTENGLSDIEIQQADLYHCAFLVIDRFRGNVDFQSLVVGDVSPEETTGTPPGDMSIVIRSVNKRNLEDWYVYDIDDGEEFFGPEMRSATYTAHRIREAGIEADQVIRDVAFELGSRIDPSVEGIQPPDHSVSIVLPESEVYYEVENPTRLFGADWGDTDKMDDALHESSLDFSGIGRGPIWWVHAGANW